MNSLISNIHHSIVRFTSHNSLKFEVLRGGRLRSAPLCAIIKRDRLSKNLWESSRGPQPSQIIIVPSGVYGGHGAIFSEENRFLTDFAIGIRRIQAKSGEVFIDCAEFARYNLWRAKPSLECAAASGCRHGRPGELAPSSTSVSKGVFDTLRALKHDHTRSKALFS